MALLAVGCRLFGFPDARRGESEEATPDSQPDPLADVQQTLDQMHDILGATVRDHEPNAYANSSWNELERFATLAASAHEQLSSPQSPGTSSDAARRDELRARLARLELELVTKAGGHAREIYGDGGREREASDDGKAAARKASEECWAAADQATAQGTPGRAKFELLYQRYEADLARVARIDARAARVDGFPLEIARCEWSIVDRMLDYDDQHPPRDEEECLPRNPKLECEGDGYETIVEGDGRRYKRWVGNTALLYNDLTYYVARAEDHRKAKMQIRCKAIYKEAYRRGDGYRNPPAAAGFRYRTKSGERMTEQQITAAIRELTATADTRGNSDHCSNPGS